MSEIKFSNKKDPIISVLIPVLTRQLFIWSKSYV